MRMEEDIDVRNGEWRVLPFPTSLCAVCVQDDAVCVPRGGSMLIYTLFDGGTMHDSHDTTVHASAAIQCVERVGKWKQ